MSSKTSARRTRYLERQYGRFKRKRQTGDEEICPLCQDPLGYSNKVIVTVCDHAFHASCWANYVMSKNKQTIEESTTVPPFLDPMIPLEIFLNFSVGPECPSCRQTCPMVHELPFALLSKDRMKMVKNFQGLDMEIARHCRNSHPRI